MRGRAQLELTPRAFKDAGRAERQRALAQLLAILREAAASNAPWYVWVRDEWPKMKALRR